MIGRVAGTIADWGRGRGYFASARTATPSRPSSTYILLHQMAAFNSPVWFNVGLRGAAAVLGLLHPLRRGHDGVDPRLEHARGQIFRGGSGSGINLSTSAARWSR
jgi:ribonucleoside-diphosphate reductase alpha chain